LLSFIILIICAKTIIVDTIFEQVSEAFLGLSRRLPLLTDRITQAVYELQIMCNDLEIHVLQQIVVLSLRCVSNTKCAFWCVLIVAVEIHV